MKDRETRGRKNELTKDEAKDKQDETRETRKQDETGQSQVNHSIITRRGKTRQQKGNTT